MYDKQGTHTSLLSYTYTDNQSLSLVKHERTRFPDRFYVQFDWVKLEDALNMNRVISVSPDPQTAHKILDALHSLMIIKGETVVVSRHDGTH